METLEIPIKKVRYTRSIPEKYARVLNELTWRCYEKEEINERVFEDLVVDLKFKYKDVGYVIAWSDLTAETDEDPVHLVRVVDLSDIVSNLDKEVLRVREIVTIPIASAVYYGCDTDYRYLFNVDVDAKWLRSVYDRKEIAYGVGSQRVIREFMDDVADLLHEYIPAAP
jgi:hypothetical protein